jgi:death-on-curing protein
VTTDPPWGDLISHEDVLRLHSRGLREYGGDGDSSELGEGCIDGTLGAAWSAGEYLEEAKAIPGLVFAAYVLHHLAVKSCFLDGNKRVAWLVAVNVLARVGVTLSASEEEAYEMITEMLVESREPAFVVQWLAAHLVVF